MTSARVHTSDDALNATCRRDASFRERACAHVCHMLRTTSWEVFASQTSENMKLIILCGSNAVFFSIGRQLS